MNWIDERSRKFVELIGKRHWGEVHPIWLKETIAGALQEAYDKGRVDGQTKTPTYNDGLRDGYKQGVEAGAEEERKRVLEWAWNKNDTLCDEQDKEEDVMGIKFLSMQGALTLIDDLIEFITNKKV